MRKSLIAGSTVLLLALGSLTFLNAQDANRGPQDGPPGGPRGFGGPGGPGGFGGPGGPMGQEIKLVKQFDKDGDKRLNREERDAAREFLKKERAAGRGRGGPGGPGGFGRGGGPGGMLASQMLAQGDKNADQKLTKDEFTTLAGAWFDKLDVDKAGKLSEEQWGERFGDLVPPPGGGGPQGGGPQGGGGGGGGGPGGFGPGQFIGPVLFNLSDSNKDGSLTRDEFRATFEKWFNDWDADKSGALSEEKLREGLNNILPRPQFGGPGGFGRRQNREPPKPGAKVGPADAQSFPDAPLYDAHTMRTLFFDFGEQDWESELSDFRNTDVQIPATLTVDGKSYPNVGVHFRGMSSLMMVSDGFKRSLGVSLDFADKKQKFHGHKTLNLLNSHEDPTFLHTVLYNDIAGRYIPTPKANFAKVVINGESWGVYVNAEQFNKEFLKEWFADSDGPRWKVRGSPGGRGGLDYIGQDAEPYKRIYSIKSKDVPQAWNDLIRLCKTLSETPPDKLEAALEPMLEVDGALWFLALENTFINGDGYWVRASDYCLYEDGKGRFHVIPSDTNETFGPAMGPGMGPPRRGGGGGPGGFGGPGGGPGGGPNGPGGFGGGGFGGPGRGPGRGPGGGAAGLEIDPLVGVNPPDNTKPLRSKLLAVPALRQRYLEHVRTLADDWLDWDKLSPVVRQYRDLVEKEVAADTRKLEDDFAQSIDGEDQQPQAQAGGGGGAGPRGGQPGRSMSLKTFAQRRRTFLLNHAEIKKLGAPAEAAASAAAAPTQREETAPASQVEAPKKSDELFQETKVWNVHLTFTPEQFAAMEPAGGPGGFAGPGGGPPGGGPPRGFGPGMFLGPAFAQAGDTDGDRKLSRQEFLGLADKWFGVWDNAGTGKVNSDQLREGLNATFMPPGGPGGPGGPRGPGGGPPGMMLQGREGTRNGLASAIGIEFTYVHADLDFAGQTLKDVAVRYKGNGTFLQSRAGAKRSLKIDLNEFNKDQKLAGVSKLNLHNNVTDPSSMNEVLSHRLFRDAGVPAPRSAYARVYLTVPGKYDHQYLGLYSLVENVDGDFAEQRFETRKGALFKPVTPAVFSDLGDDWTKYKQTYDPKSVSKEDEKRVIEFAKLVSHADDDQFASRLGDYVDLDELSRYMAVTVWLSTLDSILGPGQNYYLYLSPRTNKFQFMPWDLDHSFGQFFLMGTQEQREKLSIHHPWTGDNRFLERVFKVEAFKKAYLARLDEYSKTVFQPERFAQQVDAIAAAIGPAVREESPQRFERFEKVVAGEPVGPEMSGLGGPPGGGPGGPRGGGPGGAGGGPPPGFPPMQPAKPIKGFVTARFASVNEQLSGKSQGMTVQPFGPFGGGGGPRGPGGPPGGGPGRPGGGPGGPPGGFGPGNMLAVPFMNALDADKDGQLTREEVRQGFGKWFDAWNEDNSGVLSDEQLRDGLNQAFMPGPRPQPREP